MTFSSAEPVDAKLIEDLVAANRILAHHGVLDAGLRLDAALQQSAALLMSRARAPVMVSIDDIMEFDLDFNPVDQRDRRCFLERFIDGCAYEARPDVRRGAQPFADCRPVLGDRPAVARDLERRFVPGLAGAPYSISTTSVGLRAS